MVNCAKVGGAATCPPIFLRVSGVIMKWLLLPVIFFFSACSLFVTEPTVKMKDVNIVGLGADGVDLEFYLAVTNTNSFDLKLKGYTYDLQVMALPLTKGGMREPVEFPAETTTDVRLPLRIAYRDLWEILKRRPDPDKVPYRLLGGLEVDTPLGTSMVPVTSSGNFSIPERYRPSGILQGVNDLVNRLHK